MEMISPQTYREQNKDKKLEELLSIKDELEKDIREKEQIMSTGNSPFIPIGDVETILNINRQYLKEIETIIQDKISEYKHQESPTFTELEENNFKFLNNNIKEISKKMAEAYENNDQDLFDKLQIELKKETQRQLRENADNFAKDEIKKQKEKIESNLDHDKIASQQKIIDNVNNRIKEYLLKTFDMTTPEYKALEEEMRREVAKMTYYKEAIYDEELINRLIEQNNRLYDDIVNNRINDISE